MLPLGSSLLPALLPALLFGPGLILHEVLFERTNLVSLFLLSQHLPSLFLPVLVLVSDGIGVYCGEFGNCFAPEFRHLGQTKEGKTAG